VPFVSKATGVPLAKLATKVMLGRSLAQLGFDCDLPFPAHISVKESALPFKKFPGVDVLLGPEMKSTGEVMGIADEFGAAYAKAQSGVGQRLPSAGAVFISVADKDKLAAKDIAASFQSLKFKILATSGTALFLAGQGIPCQSIHKVSSGRPHIVDFIKNNAVQVIVNTGYGRSPSRDGFAIRQAALGFNIPYTTTMAGAKALCRAIERLKQGELPVSSLQAYYAKQTIK
jgi:carbamoyl-phosphate synthase large subunit